MRTSLGSKSRLLVGTLLLLCGASFFATAQAAPVVTVYGLVVNGVNAPCGEVVKTNDKVCVSFSSNQNANFSVTLQKDSGPIQGVQQGSLFANQMHETCVSAGVADGIQRTFRVSVSNSYGSDSETCAYVVGTAPTTPAPTVTVLGLRVNGASAACGATVMSGDQVCLRFRSDQNGTATVSVQKGTTTTIVAQGSVTAGVTYVTCVSAGSADNVTRTFSVRVSNANGADTESCSYKVAGVSPTPPSVTITGLRDNGTSLPCGESVKAGDQVCVRFNSNQNGNATVSVQKGTTTTVVANGSVSAGINYVTCVSAGTADNITRTFVVKVSNANGSDTETCQYTVSP